MTDPSRRKNVCHGESILLAVVDAGGVPHGIGNDRHTARGRRQMLLAFEVIAAFRWQLSPTVAARHQSRTACLLAKRREHPEDVNDEWEIGQRLILSDGLCQRRINMPPAIFRSGLNDQSVYDRQPHAVLFRPSKRVLGALGPTTDQVT